MTTVLNVFKGDQVFFPKKCVVCCKPSEKLYKAYALFSRTYISVPVCKRHYYMWLIMRFFMWISVLFMWVSLCAIIPAVPDPELEVAIILSVILFTVSLTTFIFSYRWIPVKLRRTLKSGIKITIKNENYARECSLINNEQNVKSISNTNNIRIGKELYIIAKRSANQAAESIAQFLKIKDKETLEKLVFDLTIFFIAITATAVRIKLMLGSLYSPLLRDTIMHSVDESFFDDLKNNKQTVNAEFVIRDKEEINFFAEELSIRSGANIDKENFHLQTTLYTIASILFGKRCLEYQEALENDLEIILEDKDNFWGFESGDLVYQHYAGDENPGYMVVFSTILGLHISIHFQSVMNKLQERFPDL